MSRKQRRRAKPVARVRVADASADPRPPDRAVIACPDCDSEVEIIEVAPRVYRGEVRHDDSCPWYAALKRDLT